MQGRQHGLGRFTWTDGGVYEGEWEEGLKHGFGMNWNGAGKLTRCGRWEEDEIEEACPVPRSKLLFGEKLSDIGEFFIFTPAALPGSRLQSVDWLLAAAAARLLAAFATAKDADPSRLVMLPTGGHFVGEYDMTTSQPHGQGKEYDSGGKLVRSGEWRQGWPHGIGQCTPIESAPGPLSCPLCDLLCILSLVAVSRARCLRRGSVHQEPVHLRGRVFFPRMVLTRGPDQWLGVRGVLQVGLAARPWSMHVDRRPCVRRRMGRRLATRTRHGVEQRRQVDALRPLEE